eukprot:Gb_22931 [translate_table: standard]
MIRRLMDTNSVKFSPTDNGLHALPSVEIKLRRGRITYAGQCAFIGFVSDIEGSFYFREITFVFFRGLPLVEGVGLAHVEKNLAVVRAFSRRRSTTVIDGIPRCWEGSLRKDDSFSKSAKALCSRHWLAHVCTSAKSNFCCHSLEVSFSSISGFLSVGRRQSLVGNRPTSTMK